MADARARSWGISWARAWAAAPGADDGASSARAWAPGSAPATAPRSGGGDGRRRRRLEDDLAVLDAPRVLLLARRAGELVGDARLGAPRDTASVRADLDGQARRRGEVVERKTRGAAAAPLALGADVQLRLARTRYDVFDAGLDVDQPRQVRVVLLAGRRSAMARLSSQQSPPAHALLQHAALHSPAAQSRHAVL